ncbi:MAG: hypothetical protein Kow00124_21150 [Anaerolineae bacterium]
MRRIARLLRWNRTSAYLMSVFVLIIGLIIYVWWPLAEEYLALVDWQGRWWLQIDWLLIGIFVMMSLLLMAEADLKSDLLTVLVGAAGGLVIESWGTQTAIWTYYTQERPPLWIIPAWPIASLAIVRIYRLLNHLTSRRVSEEVMQAAYWLILPAFYALMLIFVWPTLDRSLTIAALVLCALLIASPTDHRAAVLMFAAGAGLGYFLELWGTTRLCWTYYTLEQPPLFAVLAHGMAALAFWRVDRLLRQLYGQWQARRSARRLTMTQKAASGAVSRGGIIDGESQP